MGKARLCRAFLFVCCKEALFAMGVKVMKAELRDVQTYRAVNFLCCANQIVYRAESCGFPMDSG
ncbi:hypothetical protein VE26_04265 [Devosia chinhatensis]|uniref:Uncharacterized protein n=1 Tax=Devosia chinhatensis TaxID=429727 RepID=A0A0F5FJZ4_9HYPH|nr:hypothetical protein VE26_04265 [Devosia chinhatensis]